MPGEKSARRRGVLLVLTATVIWSLAGLFARLARPSRPLDGDGLAGAHGRGLHLDRRASSNGAGVGWTNPSASGGDFRPSLRCSR